MQKYVLSLVSAWIILVSGVILPGNSQAQSDSLSFIHLTDIHLIFNIDLYQQQLADNRRHYSQGVEPFRNMLHSVRQRASDDFIAITGDLIDYFEAETPDGGMYDFQVEQFTRIVREMPFPVYLTLGNHDITSYTWDNDARKTSQFISGKARAAWIKNAACFANGTYYSQLMEVGATRYRLIFLDNSFNSFAVDDNVTVPYIDKIQLAWLRHQIGLSEDDVEIVLMHLPMPAGKDQPEPDNEIYKVLSESTSVKLILSGHRHQNVIDRFGMHGTQGIYQVQTGAFAQDTSNWRRITLCEDKIKVSFKGKDESELTIPVKLDQ